MMPSDPKPHQHFIAGSLQDILAEYYIRFAPKITSEFNFDKFFRDHPATDQNTFNDGVEVGILLTITSLIAGKIPFPVPIPTKES